MLFGQGLRRGFEFALRVIRQNNPQRDQQIAPTSLAARQAFATQAQRPRAVGPRRYSEFDRILKSWHVNFCSEHRLVKRDRQVEPEIPPLNSKKRMLGDADRYDRIACRSAPGTGLPLPL